MSVFLAVIAAVVWYATGATSYLHWIRKWDDKGPRRLDRAIAAAMGLLGPLAYASCWFAGLLFRSVDDDDGGYH